MKNISVIYQIISKINNNIYIGSAVNYGHRINMHLRELRLNKHGNLKLQNHVNKYGIENLQFSILESVMFREDLIKREQYYIDNLKPEFNICMVAGSRLNSKWTEISKEKMRKPKTEEHKEHLKIARNNRPLFSKQTKQKMKETSIRIGNNPPSAKGRKLSKEHIENLVNGHKKVCKGLINLQYIKDNINVKTQKQIANELNIHQSTISKLLKRCA